MPNTIVFNLVSTYPKIRTKYIQQNESFQLSWQTGPFVTVLTISAIKRFHWENKYKIKVTAHSRALIKNLINIEM